MNRKGKIPEYIKAMVEKYPNMEERKERKDIFVILATTV
jgi:hypothetical protein